MTFDGKCYEMRYTEEFRLVDDRARSAFRITMGSVEASCHEHVAHWSPFKCNKKGKVIISDDIYAPTVSMTFEFKPNELKINGQKPTIADGFDETINPEYQQWSNS